MSELRMASPVGCLLIREEQGRIKALHVLESGSPDDSNASPVLMGAKAQLEAYFAGRLTAFDLPLSPQGTAFEREVWAALLEIPCGQTRSYRQIAERLGRPSASRAVGRACSRNPILILIPCHRVIAASGALTGFAAGLECKRFLLRMESGKTV